MHRIKLEEIIAEQLTRLRLGQSAAREVAAVEGVKQAVKPADGAHGVPLHIALQIVEDDRELHRLQQGFGRADGQMPQRGRDQPHFFVAVCRQAVGRVGKPRDKADGRRQRIRRAGIEQALRLGERRFFIAGGKHAGAVWPKSASPV